MRELAVRTTERETLVDVTRQVAEAVAASGIAEGVVTVFSPHTTAGVTVNENADPDVASDIVAGLARMVPRHGWRHREGNADAHLKTVMVGTSVQLPVTGGRIALGTWQGVYLAEFDGPRSRRLLVSVVGE